MVVVGAVVAGFEGVAVSSGEGDSGFTEVLEVAGADGVVGALVDHHAAAAAVPEVAADDFHKMAVAQLDGAPEAAGDAQAFEDEMAGLGNAEHRGIEVCDADV